MRIMEKSSRLNCNEVRKASSCGSMFCETMIFSEIGTMYLDEVPFSIPTVTVPCPKVFAMFIKIRSAALS